MKHPSLDVLPVFRSVMQAELLELLLPDPTHSWSNKELADRLGAELRTVTKETRRLSRAGLLESDSAGRTLLYHASTDSPFYQPLLELVERSVGPIAELRRLLKDVAGIYVAAVFGSWARGTDIRPTSDVDVLVVGDAAFEELADIASDIEARAGREIQMVPLTWEELDERIASDSGFVKSVLEGPLTPLVGDVNALRERRRG